MLDIVLHIMLFLVGLVSIVKGADWLTDGAADVAQRFGIPSIVVGFTIVAIGSSAPEFVVSVVAALQGNVDMALGNVVGSNIFNVLVIMGITAMVSEIKVERTNVRYDVPFAVLSSVVVAITAFDTFLNGDESGSISRTDGMMMLAMFAIFLSYTISQAQRGTITDASAATGTEKLTNNSEEETAASAERSLWKVTAMIVVGLAMLIIGGDWMVSGASSVALAMGIPQSIIALTIVSMGTSAPELAASVMAARKGDTAMALGNVVGSVVFNVFFVLGSAAVIHPLSIGGVTTMDILVLLAATIALWVFCKFGKTYYTLTRMEGLMLLIMAAAYYVYIVAN